MGGKNHYPNCRCAWCIKDKRQSNSNLLSNIKKFVFDNGQIYSVDVPQLEAETRPTICSYCGAEVYYYQNERGSKVFFNQLGAPWEKHECKEYLQHLKRKLIYGL